jgi:hypothetical protein
MEWKAEKLSAAESGRPSSRCHPWYSVMVVLPFSGNAACGIVIAPL